MRNDCNLDWDITFTFNCGIYKKSLKISKGYSEAVYWRRDNTMVERKVRRYQRGIQKPFIEGQTIQWSKEKEQKDNDLQNTTQKNKDWETRTN